MGGEHLSIGGGGELRRRIRVIFYLTLTTDPRGFCRSSGDFDQRLSPSGLFFFIYYCVWGEAGKAGPVDGSLSPPPRDAFWGVIGKEAWQRFTPGPAKVCLTTTFSMVSGLGAHLPTSAEGVYLWGSERSCLVGGGLENFSAPGSTPRLKILPAKHTRG